MRSEWPEVPVPNKPELCVDLDRVHVAGFSTGAFLHSGVPADWDVATLLGLTAALSAALGVFCAVSHREGKFQMMWAGPPSLNGGVPGGQEMYPCAAGDDGEAVYEPGGAGFHPTKDIESHRLLG